MLTVLAALALVPPPAADDQRTAILASVNSLVDALTSSDGEAIDALLERDGSFVAVDMMKPGTVRQAVTSFADVRKDANQDGPVMLEQLGIPTVLQRGPIAHVWVPYSFAVKGRKTHCGIDAFTLVRRDDRWRVAGLVYTVEPLDQCAALAAPEVPRN